MQKVITIADWWDGPLSGLAEFEDDICIYERIFDEKKDDWIDEYYLTPINYNEKFLILKDWEEWCRAVSIGDIDSYYKIHSTSHFIINNILENSTSKRKFRKKAIFKGKFETGFIPVNYNVEWYD